MSKLSAKEYLMQIEKLDTIIKNKLIEKQQWEDIALCMTARSDGERVQASGRPSKMADAMDRFVDIEKDINMLVDRFVDTKREVVSVIEQLDNPVEYDVLHRRFVQFKSLQEIADKYKKRYEWATTTQGRALANVQKILDAKK